MTLKMLLWYGLGSVIWFVGFGFVVATVDLQLLIVGNFAVFSLGLVVGISAKDYVATKPWLLAFLPPLHLLAGFFL